MPLIQILLLGLFLSLVPPALAISAFPGAEGFGSQTIGGRGGRIIFVTNLNDSGSGSFRQAVEAETGPRIVVFKIGGLLSPASEISINNPFITIAGQTAPGNGIAISGVKLAVKTHDVIIRGLKSRVGIDPNRQSDPDGIGTLSSTSQEVYNVIIDHNSLTWAIDENASTYDGSANHDQTHDITFSWNILAEGLYCSTHSSEPIKCGPTSSQNAHSMGFLLGDYSKNISLHHNLLASNHGRNPLIHGGTTSEIINNVIYNWGEGPTIVSDGNGTGAAIFTNILGNYYQPTSASKVRQNSQKGIYVKCATPPSSRVHVKGNVGPGRLTDSGDEWGPVTFEAGCDLTGVRTDISALATTGRVTVLPVMDAYALVLNHAGASSPIRDATDQRIIKYVRDQTSPINNTQWFVDSPNDVGSIPVYPTGTPIVDNDQDGIPDSWEQSRGGDLSPLTTSPSGYTWIEEYLNSFFPLTFSPPPIVKPGDSNNDGLVDGIDYVVWLTHYNQTLTGATLGDFNNSGIVDGVDYVVWLNNYGT